MAKFNQTLIQAGVLLALDGLHPASKGARVTLAGGKHDRHRRPVHRGQGARRRLLADRRQVQGGGRRVGLARADQRGRRDRGPAGLRDGGPRPARSRRRGTSKRTRDRHAAHDRRGLADRVGAADRRAGADRARRRPRRGPRAGRARRRAGDVAAVGRPGQPGRLADGHRQAPRDRRAAPRRDARAQAAGARARARGRARRPRRAALEVDDVGDDLLAARVHLLPPGALHRGAGRAHAAAARRPHHARDRARVPRLGGDRRAAHRARQAHARGSARSVRGAERRRARAAPRRRCSRSSTWSSTRATRRPPATTGRARSCATRRCGSGACSPSWRRASPRSTASSR